MYSKQYLFSEFDCCSFSRDHIYNYAYCGICRCGLTIPWRVDVGCTCSYWVAYSYCISHAPVLCRCFHIHCYAGQQQISKFDYQFCIRSGNYYWGMYVYSALQEPEFTTRMVMQEDGSYLRQEGIPNSNYIRGTVRTVYTFIEACIPSTQGLNIARSEGVFSPLAIICQLCVTILTIAAGVTLFKKKDIK